MVYPDEYQEYEQPRSFIEIFLDNIIVAITSLFIIVIGFFMVIVVISTINTQSAIPYTNYTADFPINDPLSTNVVYTSNPLLSTITVKKYNSSNTTWGTVDSAFWSYSSARASITITGGMEHFITSVRVDAGTSYAETPVVSTLTAWAIAIVIMAIAGIFGLVAWNKYKRQQRPPYGGY